MVKIKFMRSGYLLGFLLSTVQAQESYFSQEKAPLIVNSGEAEYDGQEVRLLGQVSVQHGLGHISAQRLLIQPSADKKNPFGLFKIIGNVCLKFKGGGELYCQQAEIDSEKMQGIFLGDDEQPDTMYRDSGKDKQAPHLEIKSRQMALKMDKDPAPSDSAKILITQIKADQDVRVHYNRDYLILADHALYEQLKGESSSKSGLLTLSVQEKLLSCKITNLNGDCVSAHRIQLRPMLRQLWLEQPTGIFYLQREGQALQTLEFSAHELTWDDQQQTLHFKGKVHINQNGTFQLSNIHELFIAQALIDGKKTLRFLQASRETRISYWNSQKNVAHHMHCPGPLLVDHERQEMRLQGVIDESKEKANQSQQVYIEDVLGDMYADQVLLSYTWKDHQFILNKMILEGHVRLINRFDGHLEEPVSVLHYALADRVECFFKEQEMLLMGKDGQRVLFFDKINNIQMSAFSLKLRRDAQTHKAIVQGIGDVRFILMEKELEQLKHHFSAQKELKNAISEHK